MNNVTILGRLTRDVELRQTNSGKSVANMTVAINRGFGKDDEADFIPVVVWEKTAENCAKFLAKGRQVAVTGRLQTSKYTDKEGNSRSKMEVVGQFVEFIGGEGQRQDKHQEIEEFEKVENDDDGDLPF